MAPQDATDLSARDVKLLSLWVQCMKTKPEVDYDKLASLANLKGAKSARDSMGPLLKRLMANDSEPSSQSSTKKTMPRKRKSEADEDDISSDKKKPTARKGKKGAVVKVEGEDGELEGYEGSGETS